jgi:hypothetical protein
VLYFHETAQPLVNRKHSTASPDYWKARHLPPYLSDNPGLSFDQSHSPELKFHSIPVKTPVGWMSKAALVDASLIHHTNAVILSEQQNWHPERSERPVFSTTELAS